jgi:FkbM family methyltransferase
MNISLIISGIPKFFRRHKFIRLLTALFPKSRIQLVEFNHGARFYADLSDGAARQVLISGIFDPEFFSIARPFLEKGGIFFDIGANFGLCSFGLIAALNNKNVEYHFFEANSHLCALLQKSASLYPEISIKINNYCVSDEEGCSNLKITKDSTKSFISDDADMVITNMVLGSYINKNSISKIKFMKIDVEGYESKCLKGMLKEIKKGIAEVIYFEVSTPGLLRSGSSVKELLYLLLDSGFSLFYCKKDDFTSQTRNSFPVDFKKKIEFKINDFILDIVPFDSALDVNNQKFHTDMLAIHQNSGLL